MKYKLFEILMNLFEKSLSQLKDLKLPQTNAPMPEISEDDAEIEPKALIVKSPSLQSTRVLSFEERFKLSKASYQFLMRLTRLKLIAPEAMEMILNQLMLSESRFVSLKETKWTLRNTLSENLNDNQLAFLDLVLYQKEDNLPTH